jgi:hypothetical protein
LRRPQRPGSLRAEARSHPSGSSPSRTTGYRQLCRALRQVLRTSHVSTASTLRQDYSPRNYNLARSCAEPVEESTSLWKRQENREKTFCLFRVGKAVRTLESASWTDFSTPRLILRRRPPWALQFDRSGELARDVLITRLTAFSANLTP